MYALIINEDVNDEILIFSKKCLLIIYNSYIFRSIALRLKLVKNKLKWQFYEMKNNSFLSGGEYIHSKTEKHSI